jgi:hypothetical protein
VAIEPDNVIKVRFGPLPSTPVGAAPSRRGLSDRQDDDDAAEDQRGDEEDNEPGGIVLAW